MEGACSDLQDLALASCGAVKSHDPRARIKCLASTPTNI